MHVFTRLVFLQVKQDDRNYFAEGEWSDACSQITSFGATCAACKSQIFTPTSGACIGIVFHWPRAFVVHKQQPG